MFPVSTIHEKVRRLGLEYLVIGGHAVNTYCEPRATLDVDLLVSRDDAARWSQLLREEGFKIYQEGSTFIQFSPPYGVPWRLDLMLVTSETFVKMRAAAKPAPVLGVSAMVPRPEHLIALKLHALKHGHQERFEKDFMDVLALTRCAGLDPQSEEYRSLFAQFGTPQLYERIIQRLA